MKRLVVIFLFLIGISGCSKSWTNEEKNDFINDCLVVQGTKEVCLCVLGCLEKEYDNYQTALINIPKSELNERTHICLQQCE